MNFHQKTLYRKDYFRNPVTMLKMKGKQYNRTLERIFFLLLRGNDFLKWKLTEVLAGKVISYS